MRQNPHVRICGGPGSATTLVYPTVPRGRVVGTGGGTTEFRSQLLPRYARRTWEVDRAILSVQ